MFPYLFLFGYFAVGALLSRPLQTPAGAHGSLGAIDPASDQRSQMLLLGGILMAVMIGLRIDVGVIG